MDDDKILTDEERKTIIAYHHFGRPEAADTPMPQHNFAADFTETYPNLAQAAPLLLAVVLEMLAYQRGCRGGLTSTCHIADLGITIAKGGGADTL